VVQASLGKKRDFISKVTRIKKAGGVAQAEECLPSKHKVLSSNPSTAKPKAKHQTKKPKDRTTI
jgi:hypothetical protein